MALATFVKISGINNLSDARYCAGMEVNQLGFNIEPEHANYTAPGDFKEIADWVSGVSFVGEVEKATNIAELIKDYELEAIEISQESQIEAAKATGLKVIFRSTDADTINVVLSNYDALVDYVIFDGDLSGIAVHSKLLLTQGFTAKTVRSFVESNPIKGVALQGGNEIRPGFKDFDELADMLEALDVDEFA